MSSMKMYTLHSSMLVPRYLTTFTCLTLLRISTSSLSFTYCCVGKEGGEWDDSHQTGVYILTKLAHVLVERRERRRQRWRDGQ